MARQIQSKRPVLLVDQEELTAHPFVTSVIEMHFDATPVRLTVEPNISDRKHRNSVKVTVTEDTSQSKRSP